MPFAVDWAELIAALATALLTFSVLFGARQLQQSRDQARTAFEDDLEGEFRRIAQQIPVEALMGRELTEEQRRQSIAAFYHYFDLTNAQIWLRKQGRVSERTWRHWERGIAGNLSRLEFQRAWAIVKASVPESFGALIELEEELRREGRIRAPQESPTGPGASFVKRD